MVVVTPQDAAWQEIQSVGAFSGILVFVNEMIRLMGFESPNVMMASNVVILMANVYWQYVDNGGVEVPTVPKQFSRVGVNATIFFVGMALFGVFLGYGTSDSDFSKHVRILSKDASFINPILAYISSAVVYTSIRAVANIILLFPAIIAEYI